MVMVGSSCLYVCTLILYRPSETWMVSPFTATASASSIVAKPVVPNTKLDLFVCEERIMMGGKLGALN